MLIEYWYSIITITFLLAKNLGHAVKKTQPKTEILIISHCLTLSVPYIPHNLSPLQVVCPWETLVKG